MPSQSALLRIKMPRGVRQDSGGSPSCGSSNGRIDEVRYDKPLVLAQGGHIEPATSIAAGNSDETIAAASNVDHARRDWSAIDMADNRPVGTGAVEEEIFVGEVPAHHPFAFRRLVVRPAQAHCGWPSPKERRFLMAALKKDGAFS
jgi:hypothetical protein